MKSYFITPVFNKENMIGKVLEGIAQSVSGAYTAIFIIDGCTDKSEEIIKSYNNPNVVLLHAPNVHEIKSLNIGLSYIRDNCNPSPNDLIFTVQDDVIIEEENIDTLFANLFEEYTDLGYMSFRLGVSMQLTGDSISEYNFVESEFGHWKQLGLKHFQEIKHGELVEAEAVIRSPTCVLWKRYTEVGFYNDDLAPCGCDCQDFSIRMNMHGYRNGVYALKYRSDVGWGSTREKAETEVNSKFGQIHERNRQYLARTYRNYFEGKQ